MDFLAIYPHWFWVADPADGYNCSAKTYDEWAATGTPSPILGAYFFIYGAIVMSLYVVVIWAMTDNEILRQPCYKLMYFNCFIDLGNLLANSLVFGIMFYQGAVFCTHPFMAFFFGAIALGCWCSSCFNCIAIGINRCCTMFGKATWMFTGKRIYVWLFGSVCTLFFNMCFTRTVIFNSTMGAYFYIPFIQPVEIELTEIRNIVHPFINCFTAIMITLLYAVLCGHVAVSRDSYVKNATSNSSSRTQHLLFIQCVVICLATCFAAYIYIYMQFFPCPNWLIIVASIAYQTCSAIPCFAYLIFNSAVRKRAKAIILLRMPSTMVAPTTAFRNNSTNNSHATQTNPISQNS